MELKLVQDVVVLGIDVVDDDVLVDVYGGPDNACASVSFTFGGTTDRATSLARLQRWAHDEAPLTLLEHQGTVRLVDESALFAAAIAP